MVDVCADAHRAVQDERFDRRNRIDLPISRVQGNQKSFEIKPLNSVAYYTYPTFSRVNRRLADERFFEHGLSAWTTGLFARFTVRRIGRAHENS